MGWAQTLVVPLSSGHDLQPVTWPLCTSGQCQCLSCSLAVRIQWLVHVKGPGTGPPARTHAIIIIVAAVVIMTAFLLALGCLPVFDLWF